MDLRVLAGDGTLSARQRSRVHPRPPTNTGGRAMERLPGSGAAHPPPGATFSIIGISSAPTDWSQIFRALASSSLHIETLAESGQDAAHASPGAQQTSSEGGNTAGAPTSQAVSTTPPSVLNLNAYLL
ncbi:hypothetical protein [Streptomyces sp. A5-4]|uniref:hypothetical protein n=1 Tax=Streptomyces sp. A5-4 TaxID=3384771 RepID=UPI003DA8452D